VLSSRTAAEVEEATIEPVDPLDPEHPAARGHPPEQLTERGAEVVGLRAGRVGEAGQEALWQEPGVLANRPEEELVEEMGDRLWLVAAGVERARKLGEVARGFLCESGPIERRPQRLGFGEHGTEDSERLGRVRPRKVVEGDGVGPR